jgi:hypothetical protein
MIRPTEPRVVRQGASQPAEGRDSLLNAGDRPADSWANGDVFDDAPGHLFQLMNPDLAVVGVDQLDVPLGAFFGTADRKVLVVRAVNRHRGGAARGERPGQAQDDLRVSGAGSPARVLDHGPFTATVYGH